MLKPEGAVLVDVDTDIRTVAVTFAGAPDDKQKRDGLPFLVERGRVCDERIIVAEPPAPGLMPSRQRVWVTVTGRAIRSNGEIGKATRWRAYNLVNANWLDRAPSWLWDALKAAGVTW